MPLFSSRRAPGALVGAGFLLAILVGCQRRTATTTTGTSNTATTTASRPVIDSVRPGVVLLTGDTPPDLVIHGRGFDAQRNQVAIGPLLLADVPSTAGGRRVTVRLPERVPGRSEAPPSRWMAGRYPVLITVAGLRSDTAWVEVKP